MMSRIYSLLLLLCCGCTVVEPGYVGIKVNSWGSSRGVQDIPVETGRVSYNPITTTVHKFPTFMQTIVWTKDATEGSPTDESIGFNSSEGVGVNVDVALSYSLEADKVPHIFVDLRKDIDYITHVYMRAKVRDSMYKHGPEYKIMELLGDRNKEFMDSVQKTLDDELKPKGILIDMLSIVGKPRVPENVEASINATITAKQKAIEAENKVLQSRAEAEQKVEEAKGEAESIRLRAEANAKANEVLTKSLSPELLNYEALQHWDGKLPQVLGNSGAIPFIEVKKQAEAKN